MDPLGLTTKTVAQNEGLAQPKAKAGGRARLLSWAQSRAGPAAGNSLTAPPECAGAAVACFQGGVHTTYWSAIAS
jgi:hypothetical protein